MTTYLTDEEREFLRNHEGGVFAILDGDKGAKGEAARGVEALIATVTERYASRTERLLVFAEVARQTRAARDELLREVIASFFTWRQRDGGDWRTMAIENYDRRYLASLAGVSESTIARLIKAVAQETLEAAQAEAGES